MREIEIKIDEENNKDLINQLKYQNRKSKIRKMALMFLTLVAVVLINIIFNLLGKRYDFEYLAGVFSLLVDVIIWSLMLNYLNKTDYVEKKKIFLNDEKLKTIIDSEIKKREEDK